MIAFLLLLHIDFFLLCVFGLGDWREQFQSQLERAVPKRVVERDDSGERGDWREWRKRRLEREGSGG